MIELIVAATSALVVVALIVWAVVTSAPLDADGYPRCFMDTRRAPCPRCRKPGGGATPPS